jgi:lipopolysaccharide heptosyltransferase II
MEKILVIKLRAVGDVVLSTIVLENLRAAFPKARIDFLTESACKEIVLGNPILNQIIVLERSRLSGLSVFKRFRENLRLLKKVRNQQYDYVFDFFGNPRSALITWLSAAKIRVGYNYRVRRFAYNVIVPSRANKIHEADWHLDALSILNLPIQSHRLDVSIGGGSKNFAETFWTRAGLNDHRTIALNFSGGWPAKRWPLDRFAHLADRLQEIYNAKILILWGPGEKDQALELQILASKPTLLIPEANLTQLAAILEKVDLLITTDSGPMHIAAAANTPCVALFGPTNAKLQGPFGNIHEVVLKDGLQCLGCNRLDCDHPVCMTALTVADVLTAVERSVAKNKLFAINS